MLLVHALVQQSEVAQLATSSTDSMPDAPLIARTAGPREAVVHAEEDEDVGIGG